jgi:fibronectin type 3 domain-containing protein
VQLTWSVPSNGGSAITGYRIYRSKSSGTETLLTSVGAVTAYRDAGTQRGRVYYYKLSAVNSLGEGAKSNEASARAA